MRTRQRGFTLIELSIVGSCLTVVIGSLYGLAFQARLQQRIGEVDLRLAREAALVEIAWRRDARSSSAVTLGKTPRVAEFSDLAASPNTLWNLDGSRLVRTDANGAAPLCGDVASVASVRRDGLVELDLTLQAQVGDLSRTQMVRVVAAAPESFR